MRMCNFDSILRSVRNLPELRVREQQFPANQKHQFTSGPELTWQVQPGLFNTNTCFIIWNRHVREALEFQESTCPKQNLTLLIFTTSCRFPRQQHIHRIGDVATLKLKPVCKFFIRR